MVNIMIYLVKRTNPPIENWLKDSCMINFSLKEILFPTKKAYIVVIDIMPKPPICMKIRIMNCPKEEKSFPVSRTVNPVTQVAEVTVKRALIKSILFPVLEAVGR
jgi:hypothetical protein